MMAWEISTKTTPTARKAHVCDECGKSIPAGSKYFKLEGLWEGEFTTYRAHADCSDAVQHFNRLHGLCHDECMALSDLDDDDWPELLKRFPEVAHRLGIKAAHP